MHPGYNIYLGLEAKVTVWKENVHNAVDKSFTARGKVRDQVSVSILYRFFLPWLFCFLKCSVNVVMLHTADGCVWGGKQISSGRDRTANAQREAEEGRRRREQEASNNMLLFYGARPAPGQCFESS
jgi:hypothetical protein